MERRTLIKTVGGIGAAATIGGVALTGSAAAADLTFDVNPVTHTSTDGTVTAVLVDVDGSVSWSGFDSPASTLDVSLQADDGDGYAEIENTGDIAVDGKDSSGVDFDIPMVDLTETSEYDDSDFEVGTDGSSQNFDVPLRVVATVTMEDTTEINDSGSSTLTVDHTNEVADATAQADGSAAVAHAGDIYDKNDADTGDDAYLEFDFSKSNVVVMKQRLGNYVSKISGGASTGAPLNAPIAFDYDEDDTREFQLSWLIGLDEGFEFGYLDEEGGGSWEDATGVSGITVSRDGSTITWEIDESLLGLGSDDSFRAGGNASAGGEEEYVNFCDNQNESPFTPANMVIVTDPSA